MVIQDTGQFMQRYVDVMQELTGCLSTCVLLTAELEERVGRLFCCVDVMTGCLSTCVLLTAELEERVGRSFCRNPLQCPV